MKSLNILATNSELQCLFPEAKLKSIDNVEIGKHHKLIIDNNGEIIELNHFIYILYRKVKLTGNKSVYPDCLNNNFALKATYEISNFIQKNVFKSKFRVRIDQLFFSDTNSFNSLLEGRRILGKIKSQDYNYLIKHY